MHIVPMSKTRPMVAQATGDPLQSAVKSIVSGLFWGVNPIFLFLVSPKVAGDGT